MQAANKALLESAATMRRIHDENFQDLRPAHRGYYTQNPSELVRPAPHTSRLRLHPHEPTPSRLG